MYYREFTMLEFKLNLYFYLMRDNSFKNNQEIKFYFQRHYGYFELLNELVIMISRYQVNKWGQTKTDGSSFKIEYNLKKQNKEIENDKKR